MCQNSADDPGRGVTHSAAPMRLATSADFWTAVQWLRKWSVVHTSHHLSSFLAILIAFFDDWRGSPEEAAALQTGGFAGIVYDLRALYSKRANDLDDSAALAGLEGNLVAMAGFHSTALYLRANVNLCDAVRRIVRSRTWSPLVSDAWELAVDDLVRAAAIDRALERVRAIRAARAALGDVGDFTGDDAEEFGLFCGSFTRDDGTLGDQERAGYGLAIPRGSRSEAIDLFLSVVEDQRIAGDATRVCWAEGCLERVARGAVGCAKHPFDIVAREAEPSVRLRSVPRGVAELLNEPSPRAVERAADWRAIRCSRDGGPACPNACGCPECLRAKYLRDRERAPDEASTFQERQVRRVPEWLTPRGREALEEMMTARRLKEIAERRLEAVPPKHSALRDVEPAGPDLWWAHAELPHRGAEPTLHVRVVAPSAGVAVELAQALEAIPPAFVEHAMKDRAFLVLVPDEVTMLAALFDAKRKHEGCDK